MTPAYLLSDPKVAELELGPEEQKVLHQVQDAVQAAMPPKHMYDPADTMAFKVSRQIGMLFGDFSRLL